MARHGLRNSTGGAVVIGALSIPATSTYYFYDDVEGTMSYVQDIQVSIASNPTGVCSRLASGNLVYVVDAVDQAASTFFAFWSNFYGYVAVPSLRMPTRVAPGQSNTVKDNDIFQVVFKVSNGANVITTGTKNANVVVPFQAIIVGWVLRGDISGSVQVDLYKGANYATPTSGSICGSALPDLVTQAVRQSNTLTGWTTTVNANDVLALDVKSVTSIKSLTLAIKLKRI